MSDIDVRLLDRSLYAGDPWPTLARLRQGFHKSYCNPPVTSFRQTFPDLATYRELARVLVTAMPMR